MIATGNPKSGGNRDRPQRAIFRVDDLTFVRLPMLLLGIVINTTSDDYVVLAQSRLARFDRERWVLIESTAEK